MAKRKKAANTKRSAAIDDYKAFIDAFVGIRPCVSARWVSEGRTWPDLPENKAINAFLKKLTDPQRSVLAALLQSARDGGIHDSLALLNEQSNLDDLRLVLRGRELPVEPFDTELYYDWTCRCEGDDWPDAT